MRKETLQNLLHRFYPEWDESVFQGREDLGFSFTLDNQQKWDWFASGRHLEVLKFADKQVTALNLPEELSNYWVCCFYSNYRKPDGITDLAEVKGPPFLQIPCPSSILGDAWKQSLDKVRSDLMNKYKLKEDVDLIRWLFDPQASSEIGIIALDEVRNLKLPESYAIAWSCCFFPKGAEWMVQRVVPLMERFPQLAYWRQFICSEQLQPGRVRAYPFFINWVEGADKKYRARTTMWDLQERGIFLGTDLDPSGNTRMTLSWRPEIVRVNELRQAAEYAQRYYHERLEPKSQSVLHALVEQFIHRAKVMTVDQKKSSAQRRFKSGEATFEHLLCEEALTPQVQELYEGYVLQYHKSPARMPTSLKQIRLLRKEVYDRVRLWLVDTGQVPKVAKNPPWWSEVLPLP